MGLVPVTSRGGGSVSPLTTKGDIYGYSNADARVAVGADGLVLAADSGQATGVNWTAVAGTGDVVGPGSATADDIATYNGATGKAVKDGGAKIADLVPKSLVDAKGDLLTATADNTPARLAVGANDTVLIADSAQPTGLKWGAAAAPSFATPAIVLGTAAAAGAASTVIRSDGTIVAFDATTPVAEAFADTGSVGAAAVAARRDHRHAMPPRPVPAAAAAPVFARNLHFPIITNAVNVGANTAVFMRVAVDYAMTVNRVAFYTSSQSGNIDVGVVACDGANGDPLTRIVSLGSTACPADGYNEVTLATTVLTPGYYAVLLVADNGTVQFGYNFSAGGPWTQIKTSGNCTTSFPIPATLSGTVGFYSPQTQWAAYLYGV